MSLASNFVQRICRIWGKGKSSQSSEPHPENLVRLCRNRTDFITVINEAVNSPDQNWDQELVSRVVKCILAMH